MAFASLAEAGRIQFDTCFVLARQQSRGLGASALDERRGSEVVMMRLVKSPSAETTSSRADSHVRSRSSEGAARAEKRVAEYLRTLGLLDAQRVDQLAGQFADIADSPEVAVELAQRAVDHYMLEVFGENARLVDPLWLLAFIGECPQLFLGDSAEARRVAAKFGD